MRFPGPKGIPWAGSDGNASADALAIEISGEGLRLRTGPVPRDLHPGAAGGVDGHDALLCAHGGCRPAHGQRSRGCAYPDWLKTEGGDIASRTQLEPARRRILMLQHGRAAEHDPALFPTTGGTGRSVRRHAQGDCAAALDGLAARKVGAGDEVTGGRAELTAEAGVSERGHGNHQQHRRYRDGDHHFDERESTIAWRMGVHAGRSH